MNSKENPKNKAIKLTPEEWDLLGEGMTREDRKEWRDALALFNINLEEAKKKFQFLKTLLMKLQNQGEFNSMFFIGKLLK